MECPFDVRGRRLPLEARRGEIPDGVVGNFLVVVDFVVGGGALSDGGTNLPDLSSNRLTRPKDVRCSTSVKPPTRDPPPTRI